MTPQEFIQKWQSSKLSERSACHEHFLDLCKLLGQPTPAESDPEGAWYTFERGVHKLEGGQGWADVWMKGRFGWEYKGKHKDLKAAYKQLLQYREDLENPPLLVVCDMDRFEVHTNFTGTAKKIFAFDLAGLADPANLDVLRKTFSNPEALRPGETPDAVTSRASDIIGEVAEAMRERGIDAHRAAHFLMKIMFSMFAEDIELLKNKVFSRVLQASAKHGAVNATAKLSSTLRTLFEAMAKGGFFGADEIPYINGGLFDDAEVIDLRVDEIQKLALVNGDDWSNVEPSIFGTLFERILDPDKRSQIGAHYTGREDILTLLEPVLMAPLRREWEEVRAKCEALVPMIRTESRERATSGKGTVSKKGSKSVQHFGKLIEQFHDRLTKVRVLDPACGSGNFLYVSLHLLLDLEKEVITYASRYRTGMFPEVRPTQLAGIELNEYAHELASVVIWIGYLQWMYHNGFNPPSNPVLEPIETIQQMDAILDRSDPDNPKEPEWPAAEFVVGNPPFLGGSKIGEELGRDYQQGLWKLYEGRVPGGADLCCYWFDKTRRGIERASCRRAGLLATQAIRGGVNREVLKQIKDSGDIFFGVSDRDWVLNGASVHVSMIGFDDGSETSRLLDDVPVNEINANLTTAADVTQAMRLAENDGLTFSGTKKAGDFNIPLETALLWLNSPNPHGLPNSDVLKPWRNGTALVKRDSEQWIIDAGTDMTQEAFSLFESPFAHSLRLVKPARDRNRRAVRRDRWWLHAETCPGMRRALAPLSRYLATPRVSKHRVFVWLDQCVLCDDGVFVFADSSDFLFGILHSRPHETWARSQGTQVRERESGFRYTPTSCFETFPFPAASNSQREAIAEVARELDHLRTNWLNPPEWTTTDILKFPGTVGGIWERHIDPTTVTKLPNGKGEGVGVVRYVRTVPCDQKTAELLNQRTLTNLYNEVPTWLKIAHRNLDEAVFAAYGWSPNMSDRELLSELLKLNLERSSV